MIARLLITALCAVGLNASVLLFRKARRAARGELNEPSVVESPRARIFGGVSNAAIGLVYYVAVLAVVWLAPFPPLLWAVRTAALLAALVSLYLAYSLLYVTRRPCPYCWSAHAANWLLLPLLFLLSTS